MKASIHLLLAAAILTGFSTNSIADEPAADAPVEAKKPLPPIFKDKNLEQVIRTILRKKTESEEIKAADLKNIYFLRARGKKIADLSGLEKCTNLASVLLPDNEISDLTPLAGLVNVQKLDLSKNRIAELSPLAKLVKLQYLQLDQNQIANLEPVKALPALTSIYLAKNQLESIQPLSGLQKLWMLDLSGNRIQDIAPMKGLKWLQNVSLQGNGLTDISPLSELTELRYTMLQDNKIEDLAVLLAMAKKDMEGEKRFAPYWRLYLKSNPLKDEAQAAALKELGVRVDLEK
jgi:Leucine-rich repeat (LRR) protein